MSQVLHDIEKKIIDSLKKKSEQSPEQLLESTELSIDQIRRGIEWLRLKDLAQVKESSKVEISLGQNGIDALKNGLPERKLMDLIKDEPKTFDEIRTVLSGAGFNAAIANAKKNGWVKIDKTESGSKISIKEKPIETPEEKLISFIGDKSIAEEQIENKLALKFLLQRPDYIIESTEKSKTVSLTEKASKIDSTLSDSGAIDVEADVPPVFAARTHPLKDTIDEIREIFVKLGFSEIQGNLTQSSFWNFDALFTPQDHPARELQDTFYLENIKSEKPATPKQIKQVSTSHSQNWRYNWKLSESQKMVLRTHTTCVTIKYLAENKPDEARVFSLGRVFRNEKLSYKHLVEFNQIEGIVVGNNTTLRDLMGIQKEFYKQLGLTKIKFWPTFFPYTEPSLQTMVYNEKLGKWVELFGMGIFRSEVTKPLGITKPVLAWGGGIERIAMLKYDLDDVREFYNNNLNWLRTV
ncbi:MAG: phenylalanine--tRNA ligase subunit alpha [Candidatus Nitrosopelagicus sp.]|nr:phenylalanine--tRNA ligase subunit alpha [Candidatus Nitrosopelagicus sp.]